MVNDNRKTNNLRNISKKVYNIDFEEANKISSKTYKAICQNGECYFIKKTDLYVNEKYKYLNYQGIDNIIYPIKNIYDDFVTKNDNELFYVSNYYKPNEQLNSLKALNLNQQLQIIHNNTYYKKQLSVTFSRKKVEELYEYLQYKFNVLEVFIRSIESQPFDEYSITILKNYHYILECKKVLAEKQKKIILAIKDKKIINYSFIHNNPKLSHIINVNGNNYLISLEKSKLGISSLDMAKLYIEIEDIAISKKDLIEEYFSKYEDEFYFDYFCFLVLLYYIKGIIIEGKEYVTSQSFLYAAKEIKIFLETFNLK